jgi:hypothetical protein
MPIIISGSNGISGVDGTAAAPAVQGADNNTGMFFPAADTIAFSEGGTEVLRLNASGNAVFTGTIQAAGVTSPIYPLVSGTAVASTSGTSIDFTGIPSWARRVTVMFNGVSTNGTAIPLFQLGTSGGVETTGYVGVGGLIFGTTGSTTSSTAGFPLNSNLAANVHSGAVVFTTLGSNIWVAQGCFGNVVGTIQALTVAGVKPLAGALDRIRITTVGGTDTFDAGSINILFE